MKNKKADMGLGTLIIFIAMILVAAVAASVLIATTSKLQNKALDTGKLTTNEIGTGLHPVEFYGVDGRDQTLEYWYLKLSLSAGSDALRFDDVLLNFATSTYSTDYTFNDSIDCENISTFGDYNSGFGLAYALNSTHHKRGYLDRGDVAKLCWASISGVGEDEKIRAQIIPMIGSTLVLETHTPDLMVNNRVDVYP